MPDSITSRQEFDSLREKRLRREVIIPLFQKMGMRDVRDNHGVQELGKDVVGWFSVADAPVNTVIVAKAGNVTGKGANEVARQVSQAFNTSFATGLDNLQRTADLVWVVTNGQIPELSRQSVESQVGQNHSDQIRWMDGDEMWNRWTEHFPVTLNQIRDKLREHTKTISDPAVMAREWVDEHGHGIEVRVKDSSLLTDRHTKGRIDFNFPDTPEGREARDQLLQHLRTGEPLDLPGEYVNLQLPEALQQIASDAKFSVPDASSRLTISRAESPHRVPVKVEVVCDDGDRAVLEYVEWRILQAGTEEITFVNDQQAIPIRFKMVFPNFQTDAKYEFYPAERLLSAGWSVKVMDLHRCLNKPGVVRITLINSGKVLPTSRHTANQPVDFTDEEYDYFMQLSAVEQILGQQIRLPDDELSDEDIGSIELLLHLLRKPEVEGEWSEAELEYVLEDLDPELEKLLDGQEVRVSVPGNHVVRVGGQLLNLGPVVQRIESVKLADIEEAYRRIEIVNGMKAGRKSVFLPVVPGSSNKARNTFLQWVDAEPASPYRQPAVRDQD